MDLSSGSSSNRRNRGYGNRREGENNHCSYFAWLDEEEVKGWAKRALIQARDEIREKKKRINELTATVNDLTATVNALRMELEQQKVEKPGSREMVVYRRCIIM
ncbi:hypothetical protein Rs2_35043 [Raphanus sativus]|nr:hypothetical protein Rs2_35043 [Raphanus sativus]